MSWSQVSTNTQVPYKVLTLARQKFQYRWIIPPLNMLSLSDLLNPAVCPPQTPSSGSRHHLSLEATTGPKLHLLTLPPSPEKLLTKHSVSINRQTRLDTVYYYPPNTLVEYPETSTFGAIGHVFSMDPAYWISPALNFAYSMGGSHGMSQKDKSVKVSLLTDDFGEPVLCRERHVTCTWR